jgi:hypothetical protein
LSSPELPSMLQKLLPVLLNKPTASCLNKKNQSLSV